MVITIQTRTMKKTKPMTNLVCTSLRYMLPIILLALSEMPVNSLTRSRDA